jgi:hypothetical protein
VPLAGLGPFADGVMRRAGYGGRQADTDPHDVTRPFSRSTPRARMVAMPRHSSA